MESIQEQGSMKWELECGNDIQMHMEEEKGGGILEMESGLTNILF